MLSKRSIIIISCILGLSALLGFSKLSIESANIESCQRILTRLLPESDITFIRKIHKDDLEYGENFTGDYLFSDHTYLYLVNQEYDLIESIQPKKEESDGFDERSKIRIEK